MFHIHVTNDQGEVAYLDYSSQTGDFFLARNNAGMSFDTYEEAKKVLDRKFVGQGDRKTPVYFIHTVSGVCKTKTEGWVTGTIVEMKPVPVDKTDATVFVRAYYRTDEQMLDVTIRRLANGEVCSFDEIMAVFDAVQNREISLHNDAKRALMKRINEMI